MTKTVCTFLNKTRGQALSYCLASALELNPEFDPIEHAVYVLDENGERHNFEFINPILHVQLSLSFKVDLNWDLNVVYAQILNGDEKFYAPGNDTLEAVARVVAKANNGNKGFVDVPDTLLRFGVDIVSDDVRSKLVPHFAPKLILG